MRTLRLSLVGTVILVLLGGLGGAVVAQDEPADPMAPAAVTGTVGSGPDISPGSETYFAGKYRTEGMQGILYYEASDPRLSGEVTLTGNMDDYRSESIYVGAGTRVLVNDDGRWLGTDTGLGLPDGMADMEFMVMHGEDAYEGLTAIIVEDWSGEPPTFVGAIVPGMPRFPEPPAE